MQTRALISSSRRRGIGDWLVIGFSMLLLLLGAAILGLGIWLTTLGGSWYYLFAGAGLIAVGALMLSGSPTVVWLYLAILLVTWLWAIWEVGGDGWALAPRVVAPSLFGILALLCLPILWRGTAQTHRAHRQAGPLVIIALGLLAVLSITRASSIAQAQIPPRGLASKAALTAPDFAAPAEHIAAEDWPTYGGSNQALRYSSLDQITTSNVKELQRVWTFRTGDLPNEKTKDKYSPETTPIKVGDSLFVCSAKNVLIALHAATGREKWRYDPKVPDDAIPYGATCRGVSYFAQPSATADQACATRIIEGTLDARLIAVDAKTGAPCRDFGINGSVDLWQGMGERVPGWYGNVAALTIVRGIIVVGGQVKDNQAEDAPSGVIRGYDAASGKLAWAWDMCHPERSGAPPAGETYTRGTPNMWTSAAGDEELGFVYVPLGNAAGDYYGGHRKTCENEFSSSLVGIDVTTGKPVWHFQTVHYDVWDYDLGSQPSLVAFPKDGGTIPAVVLPSKKGEIYVLDRRSGEPLFPIQERKAPTGGVETGKLSPTQPYSTYHSLTKGPLKERDMWGMSPLDQLWCRIQFHRAVYKGEYTPPTLDKNYIEYPSYNGGSDWAASRSIQRKASSSPTTIRWPTTTDC